MYTDFNLNKKSNNILSYNVLLSEDNLIKTYDDAISKIKSGDIIYNEIDNFVSALLKVKKVVNYQNGLAFKYDFMLNKFDNLYKDSWCYSNCCRFATDDEIEMLQDKVKYYKEDL